VSRRRTASLIAATLVAATAPLLPVPADATPTHVGVVVRFAAGKVAAGCAAAGGDGLAELQRAHHRITTGAGPYTGFVVEIDGVGKAQPDDTHYWSYWHSGGNGRWSYSGSGAAGYTPKPGTVEGWSYVDGSSHAATPGGYTYAALCGGASSSTAATTPGASSSADRSVAASPLAGARHDSSASSGLPAWGTVIALLVVLGLGAVAWLRTKRRAG
jgi:hypothetical protein